MNPQDFVHLHCHSTYSLLEALPTPEEIVLRAKELGQNAVGIADKGYTYGLIEFYKACLANKIKPILGLETYTAVRTRHDKESAIDTRRYPLVLLAVTNEGYLNLLELATHAALEGMYYKPRVDKELLERYGKGLIALSGPLSGAIPQAALAEDDARVREIVGQYHQFFGKENLYFELMDLPNVPGQTEVNQQLIRLGKELSVPLVATCSSHYCRIGDAEAQDILLCIQKNAQAQDQGRFSMRDSDFSMRSFEELEGAFSHVPEALENTRIIADRCNVSLKFGNYQIPKYPISSGETEVSVLRQQCEAGLEKRYACFASKDAALCQQVRERLEYELGVIERMGFSGYFLIVSDIVNEAKRRGITVGPGRGSAAGSIVSYVLDITTLDPLAHGLLFERFLNPERISMPDIDIDFADTRRDEVLEYVRQRFGADRVVQICTFGTLAARAAVKDVGRSLGISFAEMNDLVKLIPDRPGTTLDDAMKISELSAAISSNPVYERMMEIARKLEGKARHVSVHACGVVITPEPAVHFTALQRAPKDENIIITQYDAKPLEALGLLKMDFLGLKNLTIIQTALEIIERMHGTKIDISKIPLDDGKTFALLSRGETTGVFQLESAGMRRYLKQLKPSSFEDIIAMVSLYRPGPMEKIPEYIHCKHGEQEVRYLHADLEPILKPTYGVGIYQEQILEMAKTFAGFSLGQADLLRRAIGKKIKQELDAQRELFIKGAVARGYKKDLAVTLFDDVITPFAGYGFNKSHGACYARVAYETAYLKAHYPTEFIAALLSSEHGDTERIAIEIEEARAMGIEVLPPDVNESLAQFTALPNSTIRFGLAAIKGVGEGSVDQILKIRDAGLSIGQGRFTSIEDFAKRLPSKILNKKLLESLGKAGALDSLGDRRTFVEQYQKIIDFSRSVDDVSASQTDMFSASESQEAVRLKFDTVLPLSSAEKLAWEKETLGLYVSSHPLAGLRKYIRKKARLIESLTADDTGHKVTLAGIVEQHRIMRTKKGEQMAVLTIEDPTGRIEVTLFPKVFAQAADLIEKPDTMLVLVGVLELRAGLPQLRVDALKRVSITTLVNHAKADGMFDEEEAKHWKPIVRHDVLESSDADEDHAPSVTSTIGIPEAAGFTKKHHGPLSQWMMRGMPMEEPLSKLGDVLSVQQKAMPHRIVLPAKATKALLLGLKTLLEAHAGTEEVILQIGSSTIDIPLKIMYTKSLEEAIEKLIKQHTISL